MLQIKDYCARCAGCSRERAIFILSPQQLAAIQRLSTLKILTGYFGTGKVRILLSDILFDDEYFLYRRQLVDFSVRKLPI